MSQKDDKIIAEAKARFKRCQDREKTARANFLDDLKFGQGDSRNMYQWPDNIASARVAQDKPVLTVNRTRQYCLQIINDARQHKPEIEIRPTGGGATYKSAQIFQSVCRQIESRSNAQQAYDCASWNQVFGGLGWWRVACEYMHDDSFDQEILIKRVPDSLSIFLDPDINDYSGRDAKFGFVFRDMDRSEAESDPRYNEAGTSSVLGEEASTNDWNASDRIRVAEYFRIVEKTDRLHHLDDDSVVRASDYEGDDLDDRTLQYRDIVSHVVEWYLICGDKVVDRNIWPGKFIPLVRLIGEETVIDGVLDRKGHVRGLLDAQRAYNYYTASGIEFVALQSKTPWIAPIAAIESYQSAWENSNNENLAVLPYNHLDDDGQEIPAPKREQPPQFASAYLEGMKVSTNEMQMASGQYEAVMGQESNERSGKAIQERQRAGANSTYAYIDHLATAIRYTGEILIDLIPKVYDTPRLVRIMAQDGNQSTVKIDPSAPQAHQEVDGFDDESLKPENYAAIFNPGVGVYEVQADVGPAYGTRRQQAFDAITKLIEANENLAPVIGDLLFRVADFPMSEEIAERLKRMVPPQAMGEQAPNPEVQQLQQQLQMQHQVLEKMAGELKQHQAAAEDRGQKDQIDWYNAETKRLDTVGSIDPAALMPIIRSLVSEVLGHPANHAIHAHTVENARMAASAQAEMPTEAEETAPEATS